jgi:hypothetical protein
MTPQLLNGITNPVVAGALKLLSQPIISLLLAPFWCAMVFAPV